MQQSLGPNVGDYCALNVDPESDLSHNGRRDLKPLLTGTVHPFHKSHTTVLGHFQEEFRGLLRTRNVRLTALMIILNVFVFICLSGWASSTNSLALKAYSLITIFDTLALSSNILSAWISRQEYKAKATLVNTYTLGFQRFEVLAVFSCVIVAQIGAVFVIKEALERMSDQPEVHAGRLLPGALLALIFHIVLNYLVVNHAFKSICEVASSSWVQEHIADMSKGISGIVPIFENMLIPRVDPFFLISLSAAVGVLIVDLLLQIDSYYVIDTLVGICIAVITIGTMWPIATCSGKVLLHTTPPYLLGQLDKILSEAQTLDGVLEIKCEKFYTLKVGLNQSSGGKRSPTIAGSLQVRVRRDADEQLVLAHVKSRFSSLVPILTIQVVKDDWASNPHVGSMATTIPLKSLQHGGSPKHSHAGYLSGFNKPAAAVAPYLQVSASKDSDTRSPLLKPSANVNQDFTFSFPNASSSAASIIKPRSSQSDIARMYKAAGFQVPQSKFQPNRKGFGQYDPRPSPAFPKKEAKS